MAKMAAAESESTSSDGEAWQAWLPDHVVFSRLREGLRSRSPAEAENPVASPPPSPSPPTPSPLLTKNLVLGLGGELLLWDDAGSAFLVVRLRSPGGGCDEPSLAQYQVLAALTPGNGKLH